MIHRNPQGKQHPEKHSIYLAYSYLYSFPYSVIPNTSARVVVSRYDRYGWHFSPQPFDLCQSQPDYPDKIGSSHGFDPVASKGIKAIGTQRPQFSFFSLIGTSPPRHTG
jgi:hypothetical protein